MINAATQQIQAKCSQVSKKRSPHTCNIVIFLFNLRYQSRLRRSKVPKTNKIRMRNRSSATPLIRTLQKPRHQPAARKVKTSLMRTQEEALSPKSLTPPPRLPALTFKLIRLQAWLFLLLILEQAPLNHLQTHAICRPGQWNSSAPGWKQRDSGSTSRRLLMKSFVVWT